MPQAWSHLKNRPLSTRTHREKCRRPVRSASGAPVFANGAATAAMSYAFGRIGRDGSKSVGSGSDAESMLDLPEEQRRELLTARLNEMWEANEIRTWKTFGHPDSAAIEILDMMAPLSRIYGLEIAGHIRAVDGGYRYTRPEVGGPTGATLSTRHIGYHTHPSGDLRFTNDDFNLGTGIDARWVRSSGRALYLGVQSGGSVGIAVCEPSSCSISGRFGTTGRTVRGF